MKNWFRKCAAIASAAVMTAVSASSVMPTLAADNTEFPFTIEGEDMEGAKLWKDIYNQQFPGYSARASLILPETRFHSRLPYLRTVCIS